MKYRKKPIVIEVVQFRGGKDSADAVFALCPCPKAIWHSRECPQPLIVSDVIEAAPEQAARDAEEDAL